MTRKPIIVIGSAMSALGLIGIFSSAVSPGARHAPGNDAPLTMRVTDAKPSACRDGVAQWSVGTLVRAHGQPGAVLSIATWRAAYARSRNARTWHAVTVTPATPDAFTPGTTLGRAGVLRTTPQLQLALPCGVQAARLIAIARLDGDTRPQRAVAMVVSEGIALSIPSVGGLGLLLVVTLAAARQLSRKSAT